jgi:uncharacterized protein (UPF0276 family)
MGTVGVGLRTSHYDSWLSGPARPPPYLEMITENVLGRGGRPRAVLEAVRARSDVFLHGVSLSIGGPDPLDEAYLHDLRVLANDIDARYVSDHVCFGRVGGVHGHDLWPMPLTEEALEHLSARVAHAQERLGRPLVLENVSSYLRLREDEMGEAELLARLAERTGAKLLLDVNNVVVSAKNHGFSAEAYVSTLAPSSVAYMHVAGHSRREGYRFDDHASIPCDEVRALLAFARAHVGDVPCIFEWDENLPDLQGYLAEADAL